MAADALAGMRRGEDPGEARRALRARSTTLAEALEAHLAGRVGRSPRTVEGYRYALNKYLPDRMGREVEAIGRNRAGVRERHREIGRDHGAPTAASVMRVLRAVYARARRSTPSCRRTGARTSTSTASADAGGPGPGGAAPLGRGGAGCESAWNRGSDSILVQAGQI